jgi:uncharacterized protein YjbI with pentapeptide repeats
VANSEHVSILQEGARHWNVWRKANPNVRPDLTNGQLRNVTLAGANLGKADISGADLCGADLRGAEITYAFGPMVRLCDADLRKADLSHTNLRYANLNCAKLSHAHLTGAELWFTILNQTDLSHASLQGADLRNAQLFRANLQNADLRDASLRTAWLDEADLRGAMLARASFDSASLARADLSGTDLSRVDLSADLIDTNLSNANLTGAQLCGMLLRTDLRNANLTDCRVHGVSVWDVRVDGAKQKGLVITRDDQPQITVDDLEVAQFVYLLVNNAKIKGIVETLKSKTVLLLGRFTPARKAVLDELKSHIHISYGYVPILFDFQKPSSSTTLETVTLLARIAKVVIADLSDAKSVLQELQAIVPTSPSIVVQPIIVAGQRLPPMIDFFKPYPWFRPVLKYRTIDDLKQGLDAVMPRNGAEQSSPIPSESKQTRGAG